MKRIFLAFWAVFWLALLSFGAEDLNVTKDSNESVEQNQTVDISDNNTSEGNVTVITPSKEQNQTLNEQNLTSFIENLYNTLLQREADKAGLDFWTNEVKSGDMNLSDVIGYFIQSDEFKQKGIDGQELVETIYEAVLRKNPNGVEIDEAMEILDSNGTKALIDTITKKDEFLNLENMLKNPLHPIVEILKISNQKPFWTNGRVVKYVVLDGSKSFAEDSDIKQYIWREHSCLGKVIGTGKNISLYYTAGGFHKVALEVIDSKGEKACREILFELKDLDDVYKIPEPQNLIKIQ